MNDVLSVPNGDFENTLSFPSEETSLGCGLPSHLPWEMYHARPALHTVFSTTQLEHSITQCDLCHHGFGDASSSSLPIDKKKGPFYNQPQ